MWSKCSIIKSLHKCYWQPTDNTYVPMSKMYVTASMLDFLEKVEAINYDEKDRIFSKLRLSL